MGGDGMSEWKKVKLEDVCEITSSKRIYLSDYVSTGIPFYRSKEIIEKKRGADITNFLYISKEKYDNIKKNFGVPQSGDLLVTSVGSLGIPYVIMDDDPFYFKDGNLIWFKNFCKCLNSKFLYYWICSSAGHSALLNIAIGSAQKALTISAFKNFSIYIPQIEVQNRLVEILSRYDSLIENYQNQIKLLEEAAQRLYKEWFVDLRFPGYENTPMVDGVPEGWEIKSIIDVYNFKYGKILPTKDFVKDGAIPVYGASKQIGRYSKANCFEPKVLIGSRGNAGFVHRTIEDETYVTNNSFIVEPKKEFKHLRLPYIYESLKAIDFVAICTGAAQPQLTLNSIASLKYIIPSDRIITDYCDVSVHFFKKVAMSYKQIRLLTEARDRLLPKLMSGEIEV